MRSFCGEAKKILLCLLMGVLSFSAKAQTFDDYASLISASTISPATLQTGDQSSSWLGADGRHIVEYVKTPHPSPDAPTVVLPAIPEGADARPYFDAALKQVKSLKAGRLSIPQSTYFFKTINPSNNAHLLISELSDVTIDGHNSTFVFTQNNPGIFIKLSQRVQLINIQIDYNLKMASLGTIQQRDGRKILVIDTAYPVTSDDAIHKLTEYDRASKHFVAGGQRAYIKLSDPQAEYIGDQTYASSAFNSLTPGKSFVVFHHFYGGQAIVVYDMPRVGQNEDISLSNLTIESGPGMGVTVQGLKRGFGLWNSRIVAKPGNLVSVEYDAIHISASGGDTSIVGNTISNQGDDGINLNEPISPILSADSDGKSFVLSTYSSFIRPNDVLTFFNAENKYVGKSTVVSTTPTGGQSYQVDVDSPVIGDVTKGIVRDLTFTNSRVIVENNSFGDCWCHGILVQTPNTYVYKNKFQHLSGNAIRLLTNTGTFVEGFGAINTRVTGNAINDSGIDMGVSGMPWAAISAYGATSNGLSQETVNKYVDISDNTISNAAQACLTIANSQEVNLSNNRCLTTNLSQPGTPSINILKSKNVKMNGNTRNGNSTGGLSADPVSANSLSNLTSY